MDAGKGREHDSRDGEGRATQERLPRDAEALPDNLLPDVMFGLITERETNETLQLQIHSEDECIFPARLVRIILLTTPSLIKPH